MPKVIDVHHLFETTVRIFSERGYGDSTTQEVARQAGVNEATIFRRFGNKAKLIEAALSHCLSNAPLREVSVSDDLRVDLLSFVSAYIETHKVYGVAVLALLNELPAHPELRGVLSVLRENMGRGARMLASHQAQGRLGAGDPLKKMLFLLSPLMVAGIWKRAGVDGVEIELDVQGVVDAFLYGHCGFGEVSGDLGEGD